MQLTAAAVTPPAEHAARRPAGAAGAAAADACVRNRRGTIMIFRMASMVVLLSALFYCCDSPEQADFDSIPIVYGTIRDAASGETLDSVLVAFASGAWPDSVCFAADTIRYYTPIDSQLVIDNRCWEFKDRAVRMGRYRVEGWGGLHYSKMWALKPGYQLWRFDAGRDRVIHVKPYYDSLDIYMQRVE
jgi:hypothetical protein